MAGNFNVTQITKVVRSIPRDFEGEPAVGIRNHFVKRRAAFSPLYYVAVVLREPRMHGAI